MFFREIFTGKFFKNHIIVKKNEKYQKKVEKKFLRLVGFELTILLSYQFYMGVFSTNFEGKRFSEGMVQFQKFFDPRRDFSKRNNLC